MTIKGRNMLVFLDGKAIAGNTQCELTTQADMIEVSSPTSGSYKKYIVGRKSWKVTASVLLMLEWDDQGILLDADNSNIQHTVDLLGKSVQMVFGTTSDSKNARTPASRTKDSILYFSGSAICSSCTITARNGDYVSGSFEFIGDGDLVGHHLPDSPIPEGGAIEEGGDIVTPVEGAEEIEST